MIEITFFPTILHVAFQVSKSWVNPNQCGSYCADTTSYGYNLAQLLLGLSSKDLVWYNCYNCKLGPKESSINEINLIDY